MINPYGVLGVSPSATDEEIKKAYMDWSEKGVSYLNCMYVYDIMMDVDEALQTCDTILDEIDLGIDYTSREKQS